MAIKTLHVQIQKFLEKLGDPVGITLADDDKTAVRGIIDAASVASVALKQDALVSATHVKTVAGQSIVGAGNVTLASMGAAPLISPIFTTPTANTPPPGDRSASLATTEFVADSGAKDISYAELAAAMAGAGTLVKGRLYRITDYATKYARPYWTGTGTTWATEWAIGPIEPLMVMATATNQISTQAFSELFPQDEITYDVAAATFSTTGIGKAGDQSIGTQLRNGFILRRKDTRLNNSLPYDYRNMKWNRYKADLTNFPDYNAGTTYAKGDLFKNATNLYLSTIAGTGALSTAVRLVVNMVNTYLVGRENQNISPLRTTNSNATLNATGTAVEFFTFSSSLTATPTEASASVYAFHQEGRAGELFNNVILADGCHSNTIGRSFYSNTIGSYFYSNTIGTSFHSNTFGGSFYSNTIGSSFQSNTIGDGFYYNTIGNSFQSNTLGNSVTNNSFGDSFYSNTAGDQFRLNYIYIGVDTTNFTTIPATHVYGNYNCAIQKNVAGTLRLSRLVGDTLTYSNIDV